MTAQTVHNPLTSEEICILQECEDLFEDIDEVLKRKHCDGSLARFEGTDVRAVVLGIDGRTIVLQVVVGAQLFGLPPGGTVRIKRDKRGRVVKIKTDASTAFDPLGNLLK